MSMFKRFPGAAPPRALAAAAAFAATAVLQAAMLGLFQARSAEVQLLAAPALERRLEVCRALTDLASQLACSRAVAARGHPADEPVRLAAR